MYKDYDCFILIKKIPGDSFVEVGTRGTVLMTFSYSPPTYEVEFVERGGYNIGNTTYTLTEEYMGTWVQTDCSPENDKSDNPVEQK
jgi:hypothetical protein